MNNKEVLQALLDGKKLHRVYWKTKDYIYMGPEGQIIDEEGAGYELVLDEKWRTWELQTESKKMVTWYRAKLYKTSIGRAAYYTSAICWEHSKNAWCDELGVSPEDVLEWETVEAPEL